MYTPRSSSEKYNRQKQNKGPLFSTGRFILFNDYVRMEVPKSIITRESSDLWFVVGRGRWCSGGVWTSFFHPLFNSHFGHIKRRNVVRISDCNLSEYRNSPATSEESSRHNNQPNNLL